MPDNNSHHSALEVRRIVVLRPNHRLGNTILLTPLIQALEEQYPQAEIELVTTGSVAPAVFSRFNQVTATHMFPAKSYRGPGAVLRIMAVLRSRDYDLAIDPMPHSRSARFLMSVVRARARVGFLWGCRRRDGMLTHAVPPPPASMHCAQLPLYLLGKARLPAPKDPWAPVADRMPLALRLTEAEQQIGQLKLRVALDVDIRQPLRTLGIYAHATGTKCFPVPWWRQVVTTLRAKAPDVKLIEFVPADGRARLNGDIPAYHSLNLRELGATLAATSLIVTGDCGVMHLADAAGARVLGLFQSTEPSRYGPSGEASQALWARNEKSEAIASRIHALL